MRHGKLEKSTKCASVSKDAEGIHTFNIVYGPVLGGARERQQEAHRPGWGYPSCDRARTHTVTEDAEGKALAAGMRYNLAADADNKKLTTQAGGISPSIELLRTGNTEGRTLADGAL